jgi:hypothetical protein
MAQNLYRISDTLRLPTIVVDQARFVVEHERRGAELALFLVVLTDPAAFVASLPVKFQSPTQMNPHAGLPTNVWCGVTLKTAQDVRVAESLFHVRSRVRWIADELSPSEFLRAERPFYRLLQSWRCSNCGRRGEYPRPKRCPHANVLCGDAKLDSQIHWIIPYVERNYFNAGDIAIWPATPEVHGVTT